MNIHDFQLSLRISEQIISQENARKICNKYRQTPAETDSLCEYANKFAKEIIEESPKKVKPKDNWL